MASDRCLALLIVCTVIVGAIRVIGSIGYFATGVLAVVGFIIFALIKSNN